MAHTPGSFAQHARPNSISNSPSAHRRAGGLGPTQHASPSNNPAFPRPFANIAFPGAVSASRSAASPTGASAPQRLTQHLPLLTSQTPTSLAKLVFPPRTIVFWYRFQRHSKETDSGTSPDLAAPATTSSTGSLEELCKAWRSGVQDVVSSINKPRSRPHDVDNSPHIENAALKLLLRDPLVYTSSTGCSPWDSDSYSCGSAADLWLFVVATDNVEAGSNLSSSGAAEAAATSTAQPGKGDQEGLDVTSKGAAQQDITSTCFLHVDPSVSCQLPNDLAETLSRLAALATVRSGYYSLANAAPTSVNDKGKQSLLTSEQRQAHKRFIASIKAKALDAISRRSPVLEQSNNHKAFARSRLRLGENVVFLPSRRAATPHASWLAVSGQVTTPTDGADQHSLVTQLDVSVCRTSLLVRVRSRRIAAIPLASTQHAQICASPSSGAARATMLLAPLGCHAELVGVVPTGSIGNEHLSEVRTLFARLAFDTADTKSGDDALFASGIAICALPAFHSGDTLSQSQSQAHSHQQGEASRNAFAHAETGDEAMDMSSLSALTQHELPQQPQSKHGRRQFLWPVPWCLVVQDRTGASRPSAYNDLQSMRGQPMTPLKELVSFTLKVLNEANETTFAQNAAPYTPGEPDRLPSTRPDITPASISFPDFDFAIPAASSATPSQSLLAAGQSVSGSSPAKREAASAEPMQGANSTEVFGEDLNWMQFLPQTSEGPAPAAAPASVMRVDTAAPSASAPGAGPSVDALKLSRGDAKDLQPNQAGSTWAGSTESSSVPPEMGSVATQPSNNAAPQSLVQPHGQMQSQGSTPFRGHDLGLAQPIQTKRKAGESDIFGNLGLLTEDDFSFFDESAFGLDPEGALPDPSASMPRHLDQPLETNRPVAVLSLNPSFSQSLAMGSHSGPPNSSTVAVIQPPTSSASIEDVAMDDLEPNDLDALFSAIPGLQDVMVTSERSQAQAPTPMSIATSAAVTRAAQSHGNLQDATSVASSLAHPFNPTVNSFTPRDASGATPFGDPASLPGFTPSSLTESSPTFGNPHYKTPRTPYSPVEEYRDGATIVDLQNADRLGESAQGYRERNAASAPEAQGHYSMREDKSDPFLKEEVLRLADASTAAAAAANAANAAMDTDIPSRKRPAIVPNAFLPLPQPDARRPLQRLTGGARANLGRKYDLLGKFASKPKTSASVKAVTNAPNVEPHPAGEARKSVCREEKASAAEPAKPRQMPLASHFGVDAGRQSPSKTPSHRGQALLQLRRYRNSKASPGSALINTQRSSSQRMLDIPATPRSSDDIAMSGVASASDSDTSTSDDEDSDDALSDEESTVVALSLEDQAALKGFSLEIVASYLCGATHVSSIHESSEMYRGPVQSSEDAMRLKRSVLLPCPVQRAVGTASTSSALRPTIRRWMLTRTAEWLVQNPQFRAIYGGAKPVGAWSDIAIGEKVEVLEALASSLNIACSKSQGEKHTPLLDTEAGKGLPTLQNLIKPCKYSAAVDTGGAVIAEVLEPTKIAVGCEGSVVETLPSAMTLWDKSKLSAVSGQKHVVAKVLLTYASPAWYDEIVSWLDRLRITFETHGLGTHSGGAQSILAVADGCESVALSSYLDRLWNDGETWLDTLRSISSRVQVDLLQGKHVVMYTLQPPNSITCVATGYHGLFRLEADLRAMLSEQVGVLAEQLLVRPVNPAMMTEGGSLGFSQQTHSLRRLAFSVYDQLPRLVRRQPAKVLHGREPGAISAIVQFPAFSLSTNSDAKSHTRARRTKFSLNWPEEPAAALDEQMMLHVSYRICQLRRGEQRQTSQEAGERYAGTSLDAGNMFGLGNLPEANTVTTRESLVLVSAIDERGGSSTVNALVGTNGDSSVESCIERVWRFALAEASRARVRWRLVISSAGLVRHGEHEAWQRVIGAYLEATDVKERVMGSVVLLSVRADESGALIAERGARAKPDQEWTTATATVADKASLVLLDTADFSQTLKFAEPMPMGWTLRFGASEGAADEEEEVMPIASAMLVHKSRRDLLNTNDGLGEAQTHTSTCHVLAVDLLERWTDSTQANESESVEEQEEVMDTVVDSLHRLRLISEERHQLPYPHNAQPWSVAAVNTLTAYLDEAVLGD